VRGCGKRKFGWRFKRAINAVDSTTIQLVASCMSWAKHRRRKAAAKCHLRLDLQSFLPKFALVDTAREHDNKRAREVCAGLCEGEIVIFDKAYVDFAHLWDLARRGIFWVSRAKDNMACRVKKRLPRPADPRILKDELVVLKGHQARQDYPGLMRRVTARVEVDGKERVMVFLTNHQDWAASSVVDPYGCRWDIETFFKELKQTVQLVDFLGHSANAVKWQVWTALLVHLLLRFLAWQSRWSHSFSRLATYIRAALWLERNIYELLQRCGTASGDFRCLGSPHGCLIRDPARLR
ncbi:MAG: IS4 family transposase, partial [Candidatus Acidiferrales bacterium]